jgi:RNA polymerase sigma-70 factor, ECF subfamily
VPEESELSRFERTVLPHLSAAYNLARWLTGNEHDAEDVVQESYLRALKFFAGFRGENSRPWLLTIVRNTCFTWLERNRASVPSEALDEDVHAVDRVASNPEAIVLARAQSELVHQALEQLSPEFREAIVLRELEGMSYKEIADVAGIPVGTVMSRLARARSRLQQILTNANPSETRT